MKTRIFTVTALFMMFPFLASANINTWNDYGMMMGYGGGSLFMSIGALVWITVGVLACVWLWQNINKK